MSTRTTRTLRASLVGLLAFGCGNEDGGSDDAEPTPVDPPTLVSAAFESELVVRLTFSEPIDSVEGVEPASFRLAISAFDGEMFTEYLDPMLFLCSHTDACFGDYTEVTELENAPDDDAALLLHLDVFRGEYICPILDNFAMYGADQLLLPHYDQEIGDVRDLDGEALQSLGAAWVTQSEQGFAVIGDYPSYPTRIPIPCE